MSPRRPLQLLAAIACFVAALASIELGVWALTSALDDGVTTVDTSEEIRDELPEEHAAPMPDTGWTFARDLAPCAIATDEGIGPRRGHGPDVHRPPEA